MTQDRVAIVVQARMSSTRLPRKALARLAGEPAIVRMMERVQRVRRAEWKLVATSDQASDDPLARVCAEYGIACTRGPLDDVLQRFTLAVPPECDVVVRLTGDCPLVDPVLVDEHIDRFLTQQPAIDYISNAVTRTYPDGLDVEVMSRHVLDLADSQAVDPFDREHVTPWIQRRLRTASVVQDVDLSALRWVLDTPADYRSLAAIYEKLLPHDSAFDSRAVYRLQASHPDLIEVAGDIPVEAIVKRIEALLADEARS